MQNHSVTMKQEIRQIKLGSCSTVCSDASTAVGKGSSSNRIQHNLSTFTPPTALFQYLLCALWRMHGLQLVAKGSRDLRVSILVIHLSSNMLAVRETPVSCVTQRLEDIMPALQTCHARESCDALPLRSCKNQAPLLICSWCTTLQNSLHLPRPMASFGCLLRISHKILP